jgi:hypothetical protein
MVVMLKLDRKVLAGHLDLVEIDNLVVEVQKIVEGVLVEIVEVYYSQSMVEDNFEEDHYSDIVENLVVEVDNFQEIDSIRMHFEKVLEMVVGNLAEDLDFHIGQEAVAVVVVDEKEVAAAVVVDEMEAVAVVVADVEEVVAVVVDGEEVAVVVVVEAAAVVAVAEAVPEYFD